MIGQLILGLSIMVGLHELGHLLAAKAFGMRVEKYSIGFPPKIWGKQIGETEYSIGAVPLGGFVKISGMIDESLDTKALSAEPEPWEFRAKPAWQRLIVMMGGIIVNVITGVIVFICLAFVNGETYLPKEELNKSGILAYDLGRQIGFETGDKVLKVNGQDYERFSEILSPDVLLATDVTYTVDRGGEVIELNMPNDFIDKFADRQTEVISPRFQFLVGKVDEGSNAQKAGLEPGDVFAEVDGQSIGYFDELKTLLSESTGQVVSVVVEREGQPITMDIEVTEDARLGFEAEILPLSTVTEKYSLGESISKGSVNAFAVVWLNIKGFQKMISGDVSVRKSLSGPVRIATMFGGTWDWNRFWSLVGLLSMVLAFMNFLPIPALDGGHVMFLTWEIVTGRKPSDSFLEGAQKVGMVLLLSLMVFVIVNDIISINF